MTKRIFNSIVFVTISVIAVVVCLFMGIFYNHFSSQQMSRLKEETNIVSRSVMLMGMDFFNNMEISATRVTWIDTDGTVLYDSLSDSAAMENHNLREEIQQAVKTGYGESKRYSDTLTQQYLYCAQRLDDNTIIRLSTAQSTVFALRLSMIAPISFVIFAAVMLCLFFATHLSKSIITPLNSLNLDSPMDNTSYEELSPLLKRIDQHQKEIKLQTYELQRKKDEIDTIVNSMNEGIVLLKANGYVMSINSTAKKILGITGRSINKSFLALCRNTEIQSAIDMVWHGQPSEKLLDVQGSKFQFNASPVISENDIVGAALLFFDVTEKEKSEQLRKEFTANVSHELKSPLHSIAGYSELIMNKIATGEDVISFSRRINSEAKRMSAIIQDIITLSQLDEGIATDIFQPVNLMFLAKSAAENLKQTARNNDISITVEGENLVADGILPLLQSTVHNLCENAVKYNRKGGFVKISVNKQGEYCAISVKDNGIGIPLEHHENVFRRFYRIDKSRSRENGGSGLGLSIVKHAVKIHKGKIELDSRPDNGTKITIFLPQKQ